MMQFGWLIYLLRITISIFDPKLNGIYHCRAGDDIGQVVVHCAERLIQDDDASLRQK